MLCAMLELLRVEPGPRIAMKVVLGPRITMT